MQGIEFVDRLNNVEVLELLQRNFCEYMRLFCGKVNHHSKGILSKEFYADVREEAYIQRLEEEVGFLKWWIGENCL